MSAYAYLGPSQSWIYQNIDIENGQELVLINRLVFFMIWATLSEPTAIAI